MLNRLIIGVIVITFMPLMAFAEPIIHGSISINAPIIRAMIPGTKVAAGYLEITNLGAVDDRLVAIRLEGAGHAEVHAVEMNNGVMKMRPVNNGVVIPSYAKVLLTGGGEDGRGMHLMFMNITDPPQKGQTRQMTLIFTHAGEITFSAPVKGRAAAHDH
ncbi:MAG: copper chaperone PCu(A)C [Candidatus Puniceispirillales bacterium WSBS_2018_MAG_OTU23]